MVKKIKQFTSVLLILFFVIALFIAVLTIWDIISYETAKESFVKVAYTLGAVYIVSLLVMFVAYRK